MKNILTLSLNPAIDHIVVIKRFTPFAKNQISSMATFLGGKGNNVALALGKLGANCEAIGLIGEEEHGALQSRLEQVGVRTNFITIRDHTRENFKFIDQRTERDTEFNQPGFDVSRQDLEKLKALVEEALGRADWLILSGSLPPGAPADIYKEFIALARRARVRTCLDASGAALEEGVKGQPSLLRINLTELEELCGRRLHPVALIMEELSRLHSAGVERALISSGKSGAIAFDGREFLRIKAPTVTPVSPTGAGDAMTAACVCQLQRGKTFRESVSFSAAAATASVLAQEPGDFRLKDLNSLLPQIKTTALNQV